MSTPTSILRFTYDSSGKPLTIVVDGTPYYYVTNLQGDVMYIVNGSGQEVAAYTYDPYGNVLTASGSMAEVNPLQYRGYYYDSESGLYYLQSRYYDPEIGRFINADTYASTGQGLLGNNMFAYCLNNPACRVEIGGYASEEADLDEQTKDELFPQPLGGGNAFDPYQAILDNAAPPNPYGRHGGMSHGALIESLRMLFEELGFDVPPNEKRVYIPETNNQYRYPDLIVDTGYEKIYVQVGKSTLSGDPIAREQRAIDDLKRTGNQVWFFCYDD